MNVVTLIDFHDNSKDVDRKLGEQFVVSRERSDEIKRIGKEKIGRDLVGDVAAKQAPEDRAAKARAKRRSGRA
jgi:hypothetical protein